MRLLFCLPTATLSGGVKVIYELANRLITVGHTVEIFSFAGSPRWFPLRARIITAKDVQDIPMANYDYVLVTNAFMVPMVLPYVDPARCIFFCQDYESFHHGRSPTFADFMHEDPSFLAIYQLPVPIITISRPVQTLIRERTGRDAYYLRLAIDTSIFYPRPRKRQTDFKRILLVGNYLMPYKGMQDGFAALTRLSEELPVQLVLITQEQRGRAVFANLPFPVEIHYCPTDMSVPEIMTTCDVYCCTSWYEGLGLPALECFRCGVPVVSTRTYGVFDYGSDEVNLLLADPNNPDDLCRQLRRILLDDELADRLREAGFKTVETAYDWDLTVERFQEIMAEIDRTYNGAGLVDAEAMQALVAQLEYEGNLTPIAVFRAYEQIASTMNELTHALLAVPRPSIEQLQELQRIRDAFRDYLDNEQAEYYDAFKAKYDLCQLLLALRDHPQFQEYLNRILTRRHHHEGRAPAAFSEIRYSEPEPRR